ncbi:MAG: antibiotic biosynthesis monooxygenase [Prevotella sp.]|nr:antibiotic biosynthesis monooxygenase [Prevotella sp.]
MKKVLATFIAGMAVLTASAQDTKNMEKQDTIGTPVVVNLYYTGKNGSARKFVEEMEQGGTARAIREESGNLRYDYFFSAADPETVLLIDSWESQAAIDEHHASPMMQTIASLREKYDLTMRVERYIREGGVPERDKKFIRTGKTKSEEKKPTDADGNIIKDGKPF